MNNECQYDIIDMDLTSSDKPVKLYQVPNQRLPGYQFLSYSFNLLQGLPPSDLILEGNYRQIIEFTFEKEQISSGTKNYLVPDQFDLPSITGVCDKQTSTSSVSTSISTSSMTSESMEESGESNFDASVAGNGFGQEMKAYME